MSTQPLNILHISYSLNVGGLEKMVLSLTAGLNKEHFKAHVCCLSNELDLKPNFDELHIPVISCPKQSGLDWRLPFKLYNHLRQQKIDLIHTHNPAALLYGGAAAMLSGIPLVHTEHSNVHSDRPPLMRAERFMLKRAQAIICDTIEVQEEIYTQHYIQDKRVQVIFNGVDIDRFKPFLPHTAAVLEMRASLGLTPTDFVVGTVGRLTPIKNHQSLIDALAVSIKKYPDMKLLFVGDGELRQELEEYGQRLGLTEAIIFTGERHDIPAILPVMDVFILTSLYEGMSIALLEAMATGRPVIASQVGGNPEVVYHGKTGYLVPTKNIKAIVNNLEDLKENPLLRRTMGHKARDRVINLFSLTSMINNYEKVYQDILKEYVF